MRMAEEYNEKAGTRIKVEMGTLTGLAIKNFKLITKCFFKILQKSANREERRGSRRQRKGVREGDWWLVD